MKINILLKLKNIYSLFLLLLIGGVFCCTSVKAQSLDNLIVELENATTIEQKNNSRKNIALYYEKNRIYNKAIDYYQRIYNSNQLSSQEEKNVLEKIGNLQTITSNYQQAEKTYHLLLSLSNEEEKLTLYNQLAEIYKKQDNIQKAIEYTTKLISFYQEDSPKYAILLNNLGYLKKKNSQNKEANEYFQKALDMNQRLIDSNQSLNAKDKNALYVNMATNLIYLKDVESAINKLKENIFIQKKADNKNGIASSLNFLAATYLINGNTIEASENLQKAIRIGEELQNNALQAESYKVLSELYNMENNFQAAQYAYKKSQSFLERTQKIEEEKKQNLIDKEIEAEKEESAIQKELSEKKEQQLTVQQLKLESERKEQELRLLEQEKQLRVAEIKSFRLAKERTQQALAITQQKLEAEQKNQALRELQNEKELQNRELIQERLEKREKEKELELSNAEKRLKDLQLKEEETQANYTYIGIGLISIILVAMLFAFFQQQRLNEKLEQERQQVALHQNSLELTNGELLDYKKKIDQSIASAQLIQNATLPTLTTISRYFKDIFIIYRPQQVVSGDFYWTYSKGNTTIFVLADCTGHGVSGAFMTFIGSSLLDQIVKSDKATQPTEILNQLHARLRLALQQEETGNTDGMDISVLHITRKNDGVEISFSAAKQPLYYYEPNQELKTIKGSRKSVGGKTNYDKGFESHTFSVEKGTVFYLSSDGYADQNNIKRKKYGSKKFVALLDEIKAQPLAIQEQKLNETLDQHQQGTEQRDDIAVVGLKV